MGLKKKEEKKGENFFSEWRFSGKRLAQSAVLLGCLGGLLLFCGGNQVLSGNLRLSRAVQSAADGAGFRRWKYYAPPQDAEGYYLLRTKEDFRWFVRTAREKDPAVNVRMTADISLNDTQGWENWADTPPDNGYAPIVSYSGHFDGDGHALKGYYAVNGNWLPFLFTTLEEEAKITDLTIRDSLFQTTYEDCVYEDNEGKTDVVTASALCFANYGVIKNCEVQAKVKGAWDAGGIVGINYGQMKGCKFTGSVEAGVDQSTAAPENSVTKHSLFAGGICRSNWGSIVNCINEGTVTMGTLSDTFYVHEYVAGGVVGYQSKEGIIEDSRNTGDVVSTGFAGGVAGASWSRIYRCQNEGRVHIEQQERDYAETLIGAGICACNGGSVDTCVNTGAVTINQKSLSFRTPIYGVACNTVTSDKGTTTNSFYLGEATEQVYRQRGVVKFSRDEEEALSEYFCGDKRWEEFLDYYCFDNIFDYDPKTHQDDEERVHLGFGPAEDTVYEVKPGDSLWRIAEQFFGDGRYYGNLVWHNPFLEEEGLMPGMELVVPHRDVFQWRHYDQEGFGMAYCQLPTGESCPTRFVTSKPINWYYGNMEFEANAGLDTLWPKDPEDEIHVFCRVDANPEGDFFAGRWLEVQDSIRKTAAAYWGNSVDTFEFDHYTLDNGENIYCYSFVVYRKEEKLVCQVAYRLCDNMLAEYIGIEPLEPDWDVGQSHDVMFEVPHMAIFTDTTPKIEEAQCDPETFYGRENWPFPQLHNPFALARAYDRDAVCSVYALFTGPQ